MPNVVNAALIIDASASMTSNGYVTNTVIDSKAFVSYALPGDAIGVVSFGQSASIAYGPNNALAVVDSTLSQPAAAATAITGLQFNGGATCIGCGIQTAYTLLGTGSAQNPSAAVLFTDGFNNSGANPLTLPITYPVSTCAMGPTSDQILIRQIATRTSGVYSYMPYPFDLMRTFNQFRALQAGTMMALNFTTTLSSSINSQLLPVVISASSATQIGVVWSNTAYTYTASEPAAANQVSIQIYQPDGSVLSGAPAITGPGYVVFNIPNPAAGTWNISLEYPGSSTSLVATAGVFEVPGSSDSAVLLHVDVPQAVTAGQPIEVGAHVTDGGQPVEDLQMTAHIVQPRISVANALMKYKDQLAPVRLPEEQADGQMDADRARLDTLRAAYLPSVDILSHRSHGAVMRQIGNDRHSLILPDTREAGSYNVTVNVTGYSKRSKTPFQRTQLATVFVQ